MNLTAIGVDLAKTLLISSTWINSVKLSYVKQISSQAVLISHKKVDLYILVRDIFGLPIG